MIYKLCVVSVISESVVVPTLFGNKLLGLDKG